MDREKWLELRRTGIGGSDAAAVMGESPYGTPLTVFNEKLGLDPGIGMTPAMEWGHRLEDAIAEWYRGATSRSVYTIAEDTEHAVHIGCSIMRSRSFECMISTPDYRAYDQSKGEGILELKTGNNFKRDEWSDGPPRHYWWQAQHYMAVTGAPWAAFAVLFGGQDAGHMDIARDDAAISELRKRCMELWNRIKNCDAPECAGHPAEGDQIARIHPNGNGNEIQFGEQALQWASIIEIQKGIAKKAEKEAKAASVQLQAMLGSASVGILPDGRRYVATDIAETPIKAGFRRAHRRFSLKEASK